ncbi:MAG: low specificity L-threonine aldolase [Chlorobi bacterium]|nr:low specificity L-threonine aldolase [Chlorobiota bacterium]
MKTETTLKRGFASDNNAPVHPEIMKAMLAVNEGHTIAYGDDPYTEVATEKIRLLFGKDVCVYLVFTGTAANVLNLAAATHPWQSVVCAETSHIHEDECGAPEKFTGCKLLPVQTDDGKLTPESIATQLYGFNFEHHSQPRIISITQSTELGTVYTPQEIKAITDLAHNKELVVHVDGARIANAAAFLDISFKEMISDTGIDLLSFGGTKNGMMYGEAVVFLNTSLSENFKYIRKQGMQLASKMRYIAVQFDAYLTDDLWLHNARHANRMAHLLAEKAARIDGIKITRKVEANGVFAKIPKEIIHALQKEFFFYVWDENASVVRWMASWDTTEEDVDRFVSAIQNLLSDL